MSTPVSWKTVPVDPENPGPKIGILLLDRPQAANAFSGEVLEAITAALRSASKDDQLRCLIISGRGKHFSAGADLAWMQASALLSHDENLGDAAKLTDMFEAVANFPRPTIAVVRGAAYGGAVGLIACCDITIAERNARFCLSEARLGLLPAVIMPYLARRMSPGTLRRAALTSRVLETGEALASGLIDLAVDGIDLDRTIRHEVSLLLQTGPDAQTAIKNLLVQVRAHNNVQGDYTAESIARARTGAEGQAGLKAFFTKSPPPWQIALCEDFQFTSILEQTIP